MFCRLQRSLRWAILGICLPLFLGGCSSTHLEFDRMTGTAFPPEVVRDGEKYTLSSIYGAAGPVLTVDEDDTEIVPLFKDCISDAELDSLEAGRRQTQVTSTTMPCTILGVERTCTQFHLYGVVVNHFAANDDGSCRKDVLGRMWTTGNRQAFAMFYQNSDVSSDPAKYLRSAAHEIGHAFNLHHDDGDGASSLMDQTGVVGDNFVYTFTENSKTHLSKHPVNCRFPGMGSFFECASEHTGWHSEALVAGCNP